MLMMDKEIRFGIVLLLNKLWFASCIEDVLAFVTYNSWV